MAAVYITALVAIAVRAVAFLSDERCSWQLLLTLAVLSVAVSAVFLRLDAFFLIAMICVLPHSLLPLHTERFHLRWRVAWRMVLLPLVVAPFLLPPAFAPHARNLWSTVLHWVQTVPTGRGLFAKFVPTFVVTHVAGLILCLSECNQVLRSMLRLLGISPPSAQPPSAGKEPTDAGQYLRGGLVGAVERLLIYIFAANGAFNAIAFVITVKSIVRYQEIVKNHSAEYVLVGTLLSTLMAMSLGMLFVHVS